MARLSTVVRTRLPRSGVVFAVVSGPGAGTRSRRPIGAALKGTPVLAPDGRSSSACHSLRSSSSRSMRDDQRRPISARRLVRGWGWAGTRRHWSCADRRHRRRPPPAPPRDPPGPDEPAGSCRLRPLALPDRNGRCAAGPAVARSARPAGVAPGRLLWPLTTVPHGMRRSAPPDRPILSEPAGTAGPWPSAVRVGPVLESSALGC